MIYYKWLTIVSGKQIGPATFVIQSLLSCQAFSEEVAAGSLMWHACFGMAISGMSLFLCISCVDVRAALMASRNKIPRRLDKIRDRGVGKVVPDIADT